MVEKGEHTTVMTETVAGDDGTLDRISNLPEQVLVQVLSLLLTEDAFRTCLLSKRWMYLWTSIDTLILHFAKSLSEAKNFIHFVNYVFAHIASPKIKKFLLSCRDMPSYSFHIDQWLSTVVSHNILHNVVESTHFQLYTLPQVLCSCSSLTTLELLNCAFAEGVFIFWVSLKTMKFSTVELDDELIVKILFGCPTLEAMELNDFYGFHILEIDNKNLKTLKLHNFWPYYEEGGDRSLEIAAPYLQHLKISGHLFYLKCRPLDMSSLVSAELTFDIKCVSEVQVAFCTFVEDYLHKLGHVTELTIGTWFAELDNVHLQELKCKCLTLKLHITKYNLYGVASFLRASPHLETLNMDMDVDTENHDRLFELSKFLSKNAMTLEKFVIMSKRKRCSLCSRYCVSSYSSELAAKLLGCPRRSTKFVMIFQES